MLGGTAPGKAKTGRTAGDYGPIAWALKTKIALLEYVTKPIICGCFIAEITSIHG